MDPGLLDALGLRAHRNAWLIGGGGKTTLLYALAHALVADGRTVITSTSTRIRPPRADESPRLVLADGTTDLHETLRAALEQGQHVTVARSRPAGGEKLTGLSLAALDELEAAGLASHLLVEADGSAGRSLKAHLEHEPMISERASAVVMVIGADVVGRPADDAHVHRAAVLCERLRLANGADVTPAVVAGIVFHADGWLARVPAGAEAIVYLSKAGTSDTRAAARGIASALVRGDTKGRLARVVIGDTLAGSRGRGAEHGTA